MSTETKDEKLKVAPQLPLYLGNVLNAFENGVQLDLRVKLAKDFLCAGALHAPEEWCRLLAQMEEPRATAERHFPARLAGFALDLATELLGQAQARGLTVLLPEDDQVPEALRTHIRRNTRAGVLQNVEAQRISQEESGRVQSPPPGLFRQ